MQEKIGALWLKEGKKGEYLSGTIGGKRVIAFKNDKRNDKQPDWHVYPALSRDELQPKDDDVPF